MDKKRICFITTGLNCGGIENYLLRFLSSNFASNYQSTVLCKGGKFGDLEPSYRKLNDVEIIKFKLGYVDIISYIKLFFYLKRNRYDVICDFTGDMAGLVMLVAFLVGIKNRLTFYRSATNRFSPSILRNVYVKMLRYSLVRYSSLILSNSKSALDNFYPKWKENESKYKVIYNGVYIENRDEQPRVTRQSLGIPGAAFVVGHIGRVNVAKNHRIIMKVAERLLPKYNDIYFVLCGKDSDKLVEDFNKDNRELSPRMIGLGYREDMGNIYTLFDLFLFPSISEGSPNALIEAMLSGLAVVASNISPIKETVPEELWPRLSDPDDYESFCNEIVAVYKGNRVYLDLKTWAQIRFNPNNRFKEFNDQILSING